MDNNLIYNNLFTQNWRWDYSDNNLFEIGMSTLESVVLRAIDSLCVLFGKRLLIQVPEEERLAVPPPPERLGDDPVYDTYIADRQKLVGDCDAIMAKYSGQMPPHVLDDFTTIQNGVGLLDAAYREHDENLKAFKKAAKPVMDAAEIAFTDAMGGGGSNHDKIMFDLQSATSLQQKMNTNIGSAAGQVTNTKTTITTLEETISKLKDEIDALPSGDKKSKAKAALLLAQSGLVTVDSAYTSAKTDIISIQSMFGKLSLDDLQALSKRKSPTDDDVAQADKDLVPFTSLNETVTNFQTGTLTTLAEDISFVQSQVSDVNEILHPSPAPKPGQPRHGLWWVDWETRPTDPFKFDSEYMGQKIDFLNFFVGRIDDGNGNFALPNGFGNYAISDLATYAKQLKAKGVSPGFSIGGGGGSYDHTWLVLLNGKQTPEEVGQALAQFCKDNGFDRFDVDFEADFSPELDTAVGQMIKAFKEAAPELQITLCTYAGFYSGLPGEPDLKFLMDATKDANGKSTLDAVNIMSYTNPLDDEENWIDQWATWLTTAYGMDKSQVCCGIDDTDAHDYDPQDFMDWAVSRGYSTCHWAENLPGPDAHRTSSVDARIRKAKRSAWLRENGKLPPREGERFLTPGIVAVTI